MRTAGPDREDRRAEEPSDAALALMIADGDRAAAGVLVQRHQSHVRSFLLRLSGRDDVADDLAQETFVKVLRYADRYDARYAMRTWLLTIARRLWINHLRKHKRHGESLMDHELTSAEPDPAATAGQSDDLNATRALLDDAISRLSDPQRTAIVLFHQQELSMSEAAEVMKLPMGTVKSHLHRARAALRRMLAPKLEMMKS